MTIKTDVVIVGAGPCGLFTVFELGLLGIHSHVVDSLPVIGGQCATLYPEKPIYDIPALPIVSGQELVDRLAQQAAPFKPIYHLGQQVVKLDHKKKDGYFTLVTEQGTRLETKVVLIAAGLGAFKSRPLRLDGVENFADVNLHYKVQDKKYFEDKDIVILGGGDSALDWLLALSGAAKSMTLVHRREQFRAAPATVEQMKALANQPASGVRYLVGRVAEYTQKNGRIAAIQVLPFDGSEGTFVPLDELLVFFGLSPDLGPISDWGLELDKRNINVDPETFATNIPGIYATGDINAYPGKKKLILSAFHEAALAAFAIQKYLDPNIKQRVQYTTTSSVLQERLGVADHPT